MNPTHIELHLNSESSFVRKFGKRVKQAGGKYGHARGYSDTRYVTIPSTYPKLIDELAASYPKYKRTALIVRGVSLPSHVIVHYVPNGTQSAFEFTMQKFAKAKEDFSK